MERRDTAETIGLEHIPPGIPGRRPQEAPLGWGCAGKRNDRIK